MKNNETLIRLKTHDNNMLSAFYTEKPYEFLRVYHFCKENDLPLSISQDSSIIGDIEDIVVFFGGLEETVPCIDVWIATW